MTEPPQYVTTADVAAQFGTSIENVTRWIKTGKLDAIQPGGPRGEYRIPVSEVERLHNARPQITDQPSPAGAA